MTTHDNRLVRHEIRRRELQVLRTEQVTPHMRRIVLGGEQLQGFHSAAPDDHIKLFFPNADGEIVTPTMTPEGPRYPEGVAPSPMRDYTPRHHDAEAGELVVDFVLHGHGVASGWAANARPGDALAIGGPRGSFVVADDYDQYVLIGDETALPAIGQVRAAIPDGVPVQVHVEVADEAAVQPLPGITWHPLPPGAPPGDALVAAVTGAELAEGTRVWVAGEAAAVQRIRKHLFQDRSVPRPHASIRGYWKHGRAGTTD